MMLETTFQFIGKPDLKDLRGSKSSRQIVKRQMNRHYRSGGCQRNDSG